mmetsp:Transcript_43883/g.138533  ORF Transcript_43883/g.138533 Transcript_43883/m.138533 type:complete len:245 (+) Transcript_43883:281-1015(+)
MQRNELRYAKAEVRFPVSRPPRPRERFGQEEAEELPPHVPSFLPPFPSKHTYLATSKPQGERGDAKTAKKQKHKRNRQLEEALQKLADAPKKKRKAQETFGEPEAEQQRDDEGIVTEKEVSEESVMQNPALQEAAKVNDVLADDDVRKSIEAEPNNQEAANKDAENTSTSHRQFSLSLPASDGTMREMEGGTRTGDERDKDKKRQKAARILATVHTEQEREATTGNVDAGRSPADIARTPEDLD